MKQYKEYMDGVKVSGALHQRLTELEPPVERSVLWKRYGAVAAALVLAAGLGAVGLTWGGQAARTGPAAALENVRPLAEPDIAMEEQGDQPGEKTLGGYEVVSGSGPTAIVTHYILPYIDYGGMKHTVASSVAVAADWDIPQGAVRRELDWDEIVALMGGEEVVNTHLDWGMYALTGWAAWYEDGSFWGAFINGFLPNYDGPTSQFEFSVTAGQLPPTCAVYSVAVPQEVRGLAITAEGLDSVAGPEGGVDASTRRVSFMKDGCGYRFDITGSSRALTEERVSRLVCRMADQGLDWSVFPGITVPEFVPDYDPACEDGVSGGTYTCPYCGLVFPEGAEHNDPFIGVGEPNWEDGMCEGYPTPDPELCGYPTADWFEMADPSYHAPATEDTGSIAPVQYSAAPPTLRVLASEGQAEGGSSGYYWEYEDLASGQTVSTIACGFHPLDYRDAPALTTADGAVTLNFFHLPDRVQVSCWPDSEWGNTGAARQTAAVTRNGETYSLSLKDGGWIYEISAEWEQGTARYVFYLIRT